MLLVHEKFSKVSNFLATLRLHYPTWVIAAGNLKTLLTCRDTRKRQRSFPEEPMRISACVSGLGKNARAWLNLIWQRI